MQSNNFCLVSAFTHTIPDENARYAWAHFQGSDAQKLIRTEFDAVIEELRKALEAVPPDRLQGVQEALKMARRMRGLVHAHDRADTRALYERHND